MVSVLDDRSVVEKGFPVDYGIVRESGTMINSPLKLEVVGHCPKCGSPIYGPKQTTAGAPVQVQFSCDCQDVKNFHETWETK